MKSRFDNWSDLRVFLAVARSGSTLAASKTLEMSQPTVSRRIDALEHVLKLTLFDRDTRGFRPTQEGRRLAERAEAVEAAVLALESEADTCSRQNARPIRLTAPSVNFSANLAAALADFQADNPGTRFELVASYETLDLAAGEADVAIRIAHQIDDDRLICRKLTVATSSLYASHDYAARNGLPTALDFTGHGFIAYEDARASMRLNQWMLDRIDPGQIVSRCTDIESMLAAVRAGLGIGPLPTTLAEEDGTLLRCFDPPEGTSVPAWLLIGPDAYRRPEVKAFARFFAPRFMSYMKGRAG